MRKLIVVLAAAFLSAPALAAGGRILFYDHDTDGKLSEPVLSASLNAPINICAWALNVTPGTHEVGITLYDPTGREVFQVTRRNSTTASAAWMQLAESWVRLDRRA